MMHGLHKFHELWAWFIVKDGLIVEQGKDTDEATARRDYEAAQMFWSTHDYERE
jgi:hypothetical protein